MKVIKHYSNDDVTIVWQPELCKHTANCFKALPRVFNPRVRPWIKPENGTTEQIIDAVAKCPTGAISIESPAPQEPAEEPKQVDANQAVSVVDAGPLWVSGPVEVNHADGTKRTFKEGVTLCRCGRSGSKPYCDNSHMADPPWDGK